MKIVIDIPEDTYIATCNELMLPPDVRNVVNAIKTGTLLPKGYGRLIDADELKKKYPHDTDWEYPVNTNSYVVESIDNMPTIIEADTAEDEFNLEEGYTMPECIDLEYKGVRC